MKGKKIAITIAAVMAMSLILLTPVNAAPFPDLPATPVSLTLTLVPGHWPGTVVLSGVGTGFDVENGVPYTAWCDQLFNFITPGETYTATLVSSLGLPSPWPQVNYLLNHNTGKDMDLQLAIWRLFGFTPADITSRGYVLTADAIAMYDAAKTQTTFVPGPGEIVAVECITEGCVQDVLIELTIPRLPGLSPGFWKHNIQVALGQNPGSFSVPHEGEPRMDAATLTAYAAPYTLQQALDALQAKGPGSDTIRLDMANHFNAAAGYAPYED